MLKYKSAFIVWSLLLSSCGDMTMVADSPLMQSAFAADTTSNIGYKSEKCWFKIPLDREMTCGTAIVPEDRKNSGGRQIRLPVVQLIPDKERHEPVVFLSGGPGQTSGIDTDDNIIDWWQFVDDQIWLRGRRLVLFDQRGVGRSIPNLDCSQDYDRRAGSKRMDHPSNVFDYDKEKLLEVMACKNRLKNNGTDLSEYNTENIASDVDDIRRFLKIERWVIYGISYGTELGLALMEKYPTSIAQSILDSVLPPRINYISMDEANLTRSIDLLDKACKETKSCNHDGQSLKETILRIVEQLDSSPILIRLDGNEDTDYSILDGSDFIDLLFDMFYDRESIFRIPLFVRQTYAQDYRYLAEAIKESDESENGSHFADGMGYSVVCAESDLSKPIQAAIPSLTKWASGGEYQVVCPRWFDRQSAPNRSSGQRSTLIDVPTLMLSGEFDPITPPSWAKSQSKMMRHAKTYVFKGVGHDVLDSAPCSSFIIAQFLQGKEVIDNTECDIDLSEYKFNEVGDFK